MRIIQPPNKIQLNNNEFAIFLAGSIESGLAEKWQDKIIEQLKDYDNLVLLNPRREEWNNTAIMSIDNQYFKEQVIWELEGLEIADKIIMYFDIKTKSPISLLELGLFSKSGKLIVICPDGFWRKGNVDIVCEKYKIKQTDFKKAIEIIKNYIFKE